jgi:transposase-like protein
MKHNRKEERIAIVNEYIESGLSQMAFAKLKNLSKSTLSYWYRKLHEEKSYHKHESDFVELKLNHSKQSSFEPGITITTPNLFSLQIQQGFDKTLLKDILSVIGDMA